ncbi:MAG: hypothetical protein KDD59_09010, partial [Bdellovibrionales bacterium]|nr:hypothetical protein [Bdellovibrionales bacterium]
MPSTIQVFKHQVYASISLVKAAMLSFILLLGVGCTNVTPEFGFFTGSLVTPPKSDKFNSTYYIYSLGNNLAVSGECDKSTIEIKIEATAGQTISALEHSFISPSSDVDCSDGGFNIVIEDLTGFLGFVNGEDATKAFNIYGVSRIGFLSTANQITVIYNQFAGPVITSHSDLDDVQEVFTLEGTCSPGVDINVDLSNVNSPSVIACEPDGTFSASIDLDTTGGLVQSRMVRITQQTTGTPELDDVVNLDMDAEAPTVAFGSIAPSSGNALTTYNFDVNYSGATGVSLSNSDISFHGSGVTCGTVNVTNGLTSSPTVSLSNCTGDGAIGIIVNANTGLDLVGNGNLVSGHSATVSVDNSAPTVVVSSPTPSSGNSATNFDFNITYTDASSINLTPSGVTINPSGVTCNTPVVNNGTTSTPTVTLSNCTGDGTVGITINAGTADDGTN